MVKSSKQVLFLIAIITFHLQCAEDNNAKIYACPPCDQSCDMLAFDKKGECPHCKMTLVLKHTLNYPKVDQIQINEGSGSFFLSGNASKSDKTIRVFYHKPESYSSNSKILMVIPGAGRNGGAYRDSWIRHSESEGVLILSPMYSEFDYGFDEYHMCGLIENSDLNAFSRKKNSNHIILDESNFDFKLVVDPSLWIFQDFNRIFDLVASKLQSKQKTYDIFGHSAGGQILHRMVILQANTKADKIIAANSGFYTLPDTSSILPFGIKGIQSFHEKKSAIFSRKLIILLGENDNALEQGGTLLRSDSADKQGLHRLSRGKYFYEHGKATAAALKVDFNWKIHTVPNVGHEQEKMAKAASQLLK